MYIKQQMGKWDEFLWVPAIIEANGQETISYDTA